MNTKKPIKKIKKIERKQDDYEDDDNEEVDIIIPKTNKVKNIKEKKLDVARKERGKTQRIFLILTYDYDVDILERKYEVMGTTGNAYTVTITSKPSCTCPDHTTRYKRCKHIYFVLTRIMKVKKDQEDITEYDDDDLEDMIKNIPKITENLKVNAAKVSKFKALKKNNNGEVNRKDIDEDDMCPICLGEIYDCGEDLVYCKYSCGTSIHKECFNMYNSKQDNTNGIKCIFCHKSWNIEANKYINID